MPRTISQSTNEAMKPLKPIRTATDHRAALKELSAFFDNEPEPRTPEGDRFEILLTLVEAYEAKHFPIDLPDPVEAIKFRMEQSGLTPKDLQPMIGRMNRVYEVLNRKRPLTLPMIWKLHQGLGIPAENLIRPAESGSIGRSV
jgi:HTH-type transcriptional regulator / antitoxin HigA